MIDQTTLDLLYPDSATPAVTPVQTAEPTDTPPAEPIDTSSVVSPGETTTNEHGYTKPTESSNPYSLDEGDVAALNYADTAKVELSEDVDMSLLSSPEERETLKNNIGYICNLTGTSGQEASALIDTCNNYLIGGDSQQSQQEVMASLYDTWGSKLTEKLSDASTLINSFPDLSQWMENTGGGNQLKIIQAVIRITETPRSQHRLQQILRSKSNEK